MESKENRIVYLINELVNGNMSEDEEQKIFAEIDLLSIDPLWSDYIFWSDEYLLDDGNVDIDKLIKKIT